MWDESHGIESHTMSQIISGRTKWTAGWTVERANGLRIFPINIGGTFHVFFYQLSSSFLIPIIFDCENS